MMEKIVKAHINSLNGALDNVKIIKENYSSNQYIVDYKGKKCTAIFNYFTWSYYVDDVYGIVE